MFYPVHVHYTANILYNATNSIQTEQMFKPSPHVKSFPFVAREHFKAISFFPQDLLIAQ